MLKWAEKKAGVKLNIAQGSFNAGGVSASAGTHDGSAVDIGLWGVSKKDRVKIIRALKDAGFAAWVRRPPSFSWHVHAIPFRDPHVSRSAAAQRRDYDRRRDGLAYNLPDRTYRPKRRRTWGWVRNRPVKRK
jgi:hypothetical protein